MEFRLNTSQLYGRAAVEKVRPVVEGLNSVHRLEATNARISRQRIIDRLKAIDEEVRARLEEEAKKNFGNPEYVNTRGPDNKLYAIDGEVIGGVDPRAQAALKAEQARLEAQDRAQRAEAVRAAREVALAVTAQPPEAQAPEAPESSATSQAAPPAEIGTVTPAAIAAVGAPTQEAPPLPGFQPSPYSAPAEPAVVEEVSFEPTLTPPQGGYEPPTIDLPGSATSGAVDAVVTVTGGAAPQVATSTSYAAPSPVAGAPASSGEAVGSNTDISV